MSLTYGQPGVPVYNETNSSATNVTAGSAGQTVISSSKKRKTANGDDKSRNSCTNNEKSMLESVELQYYNPDATINELTDHLEENESNIAVVDQGLDCESPPQRNSDGTTATKRKRHSRQKTLPLRLNKSQINPDSHQESSSAAATSAAATSATSAAATSATSAVATVTNQNTSITTSTTSTARNDTINTNANPSSSTFSEQQTLEQQVEAPTTRYTNSVTTAQGQTAQQHMYKCPELQQAYQTLLQHEKNESILQSNITNLETQLEVIQKTLASQKESLKSTQEAKKAAMENVHELELNVPCTWNDNYNKLKEYKMTHGNIDLPTRSREDKELDRLCIWLNQQKSQYNAYKDGKKQTYFPLRVKALESLGIQWNVRDDKWTTNYNKLKEYKEKHGSTKVPTKSYPDRNFSNWIATQRYEYKLLHENKKSRLSPERIKMLKDIGFVFNVFDEKWDEMFNALVSFRDMFGHVNIPERYASNPSLAKWVDRQRMEYQMFISGQKDSKKCRMTDVRIDRLKSLGFAFTPAEEYSAVEEYTL